MNAGHEYRTRAERLRQAAGAVETTAEARQRLLALAELYEGLAKANDALARTAWPAARPAI